jgi:hypothetical protein
MLFEKKSLPQRLPEATTHVRRADDMRNGLGLIGDWRVSRAERKAKADATTKLTVRAVETSLDIACAQLEVDATILKSGLIARAAPILGGIAAELVSRSGQVNVQLESLQNEGMLQEIGLRNEFFQQIEKRRVAGQLTDDEAADARAFVEASSVRGCTRLAKNTERALDALDQHVSRATDHIRNSKLG